MSDYMQTHSQYSYFKVSEAWAILSDIEQSIKQKVEIVGTPLKDWDVEIYRGVLTGYNDAFIISSETRKEILDNCKSLDERQRSDTNLSIVYDDMEGFHMRMIVFCFLSYSILMSIIFSITYPFSLCKR